MKKFILIQLALTVVLTTFPREGLATYCKKLDGTCYNILSTGTCNTSLGETKILFGSCTTSSGSSGFGGSWDPRLNCGVISGTNATTGNGTGFTHAANVQCTFTDDGGIPGNVIFQESALCTLRIDYGNLTPICDPSTNTLAITGLCPTNSTSNPVTVNGFVDCSANTNNPGGINPVFCTYAGNNPTGFPGGALNGPCQWNLGIARANGNPLTSNQCTTAFGDPPIVFSYSETHQFLNCSDANPNNWVLGPLTGVGSTFMDACHSDTWDPSVAAFCAFVQGGAKNQAAGEVLSVLTADIAISPTSLNAACSNDNGALTLTIYGEPQDPNAGANQLDVNAINDATIELNGRAPDSASCSVQFIDINGTSVPVKTCRVATCAGGQSLVGTILPDSDGDGKQETILTLVAELLDGTQVSGAERINLSANTSSLISINDLSATEGDSGNKQFMFTVTLSPAVPSGNVVVNYATSDGSATAADHDYEIKAGNITFATGETSKTIVVTVNGDIKVEGNETFYVNLSLGSSPGGSGVSFAKNQGVGTILSDDTISLSISNSMDTEGNSGLKNFPFTVSPGTPGSKVVTLETPFLLHYNTNNGTAVAPGDYIAQSNNLMFNSGNLSSASSQTILVPVVGDTIKSSPANQTFFVDLSFPGTPPPGVSITTSRGIGTIQNDDTGPARE